MIENIRKIGIFTKGTLYASLGILTLLAALGIGGKVSGKSEVISFFQEQTFGFIILILLAAGLVCYAAWKLYAAFLDGKAEGQDSAGIAKRIGYFISGLLYGSLAVSIILRVIGNSANGNTKQEATATLLQSESGIVLLYVVAIVLFSVGVYQIYKGYNQKFLEDINMSSSKNSKELLSKIGTTGFIARGVSFLIFAFFVFTALQTDESQKIRGIQGVFNFLQSFSWGTVLMAFMAAGFICYGIYEYFLARYSALH